MAAEVFGWMLEHWSFTAFVLAVFVQITPAIKWNPLTWLGGLLLGGVKKDIAALQAAIDDNEKDRIRWEVLDFASACRNGVRHTEDEFKHIIALNDKYKQLLRKTGDENGVFDAEYAYIKELYAERLRRNDFVT